jgi:calcineurin-like phosphoesterase
MIMAGKWIVFDGAFNDGASASSSPIGMIGMVDSIVGDSKMAFVRKVSLKNEHDVHVAQRKEGFKFFCVLMKAVGVSVRKLKECSH